MSSPLPLYVDLDGTLVATDTLVESVRGLLRRRPLLAPVLAIWVAGGRAAFKDRVARRYVPDPGSLPWRDDVVAFVRRQHDAGRRVVLATAAHRRIAEAVVQHLGIFDGMLASERGRNLKGTAKLRAIRRDAGGPFAYMGDSWADLPILREAAEAYLVDPSPRLRRAAAELSVAGVFD